ncbi:hypothetical protein E9993_05095 [Labilibacter sediminis]|nr:hypothetical protein E9993_05095 [Labilibacter sediminis]
MKTWYKIWVLVVIGAFLLPNTVKLVHIAKAAHAHHHCEHAHHTHFTAANNSNTKAFNIYNNHTDSHLCYICNFHYSGFKNSEKITLGVIGIRFEESKAVRYLMSHSLPKYSSKLLRAPPFTA